MKSKWVALGLTSVLLLGACSKDEEEKPNQEDTPAEQREEKKEVKGLTSEQLEKLGLKEKVDIQDGVLSMAVTLENKGVEKLPLLLDDKKSLIVQLIDEDGKEVDKAVFYEKERTSINAKESLTYHYEYEVGKEYGNYTVKLHVALLNEKGERINGALLKEVTVDNERPITYTYMPSAAKTLVYENNDGSGIDYTEEFLYYSEGYVQAYNTSIGGSVVYYSDDEGLYRVYTEVAERKTNILNDITPVKQTLLPLPVKEGAKWEADSVPHEVVEDSITITTAYGKLSGVTIVEADIGQKLRFYYHPEFGMVRTEAQDGEGNFQTIYELKSVR